MVQADFLVATSIACRRHGSDKLVLGQQLQISAEFARKPPHLSFIVAPLTHDLGGINVAIGQPAVQPPAHRGHWQVRALGEDLSPGSCHARSDLVRLPGWQDARHQRHWTAPSDTIGRATKYTVHSRCPPHGQSHVVLHLGHSWLLPTLASATSFDRWVDRRLPEMNARTCRHNRRTAKEKREEITTYNQSS